MSREGGVEKYLPTIFRALNDGLKPERHNDYEKVLGVPKTTFNRILKAIKDSGLIYEENGVYYWKWRKEKEELLKEFQQYKTPAEYRLKLEHSKMLLKPVPSEDGRVKVDVRAYENEFLIQHLREGYPEVFEKYLKLQELRERRKHEDERLWDSIERFFIRHGFKPIDSLQLEGRQVYSTGLYNTVASFLKGLEVVVDGKIRLKGTIAINREKDVERNDYLRIRGNALSKNFETEDEILRTLEEAVNNKGIRLAYEEARNAEKEYSETDFDYRRDIERLALKVLHGEPLRGSCDLCSKVTIARTNP
jgi:hypothetical protein